MNKRVLLFVFSLLFFLGAVDVVAENDKAFLWQVTSNEESESQSKIYLMGSIHFADQSFYPLRPEIEGAFTQSKNLVVELDIEVVDTEAYSQIVSEKGVYKDGLTIQDKISPETFQQLKSQLQSLAIDYENVKAFKPGMLVLTLTAAQVMKMDFNPQLGIDAYFLEKAKQQTKNIIELETLKQQMNLFLDIQNPELLLKESLYSLDESGQLMEKLIQYWKQGDVKQMNEVLFDDAADEFPEFSKIYDRLFYERNEAMTIKIEGMFLQAQGDYFVVVGSGHLIGERGIVSLLKKKGYTVKRL